MADIPTGTVTLLFTDIEGSTRLWEAHAAAMRAALARHDALLRHAIREHQGHVFKTGGDAFCAAFPTAPDAVAAALEAQRALHREPWPEGAALRVRMALHSGAVELRDGDYFGAPANRVARLLATGHGGQTLLSEATHDLCRDHLPPLASAKALGAHGLKDLGRPEIVFQLAHPDLPQTFPPLRSQAPPAAGAQPGEKEVPSIAVLPFINMSRDEENEYFADGLSEELLNVLAKIRGLRVASRTSAFSFKGKDVDIPTVAQKLNVATVLEGSVRKSGKRVRITAQLIEVASDSHLWSETYDRELDDIFAVQDDIAQSVVKELREALLGQTKEAAAADVVAAVKKAAGTGRSDNPEAFQLYLQGRFFGERLNQADTDKAIELLQRAVALEPAFALAWAQMSRVHAAQAGFGFAPINDGLERARQTAQTAVQLAPDLPEAQLALGAVLQNKDWDWDAAEACYRRARELGPGLADVYYYSATLARCTGRQDEAIGFVRRAVILDPLSARTQRQVGLIAFGARRFDEAAAAFELAIDLAPAAGLAHAFLAVTRLLQGRREDALEIAAREPHDVFRRLALAMIHHAAGDRARSDASLQELAEQYGWTAAYQVAQAYAFRGEADKAFEWLGKAYTLRDPGVMHTASDLFLEPLRGDPRWRAYVERLKLPLTAAR
jgi:TolB-like protein/class 3 adenylate cyclase/Tfp pilus assembly protein PilF